MGEPGRSAEEIRHGNGQRCSEEHRNMYRESIIMQRGEGGDGGDVAGGEEGGLEEEEEEEADAGVGECEGAVVASAQGVVAGVGGGGGGGEGC